MRIALDRLEADALPAVRRERDDVDVRTSVDAAAYAYNFFNKLLECV